MIQPKFNTKSNRFADDQAVAEGHSGGTQSVCQCRAPLPYKSDESTLVGLFPDPDGP